jgi:K+-transporting ATPase KdpF subunit
MRIGRTTVLANLRERGVDGHSHVAHGRAFWRGVVGIHSLVRTLDGRDGMMALYVIAGVIALTLLIYLFVAMLKPEMFE